MVDKAGETGAAAVVQDDGHALGMSLQSRGIAYEHEALLATDSSPTYDIVRISVSTGLFFYPYCGSEVDRMLALAADHFAQLAVGHWAVSDDNSDRPIYRRAPRRKGDER